MGVIRQQFRWMEQPQYLIEADHAREFAYLCNHATSRDYLLNAVDGSTTGWTNFNGEKTGYGAKGVGPKPSGQTLATITKSLGTDFVLVAVVSDWTTGTTAQSILDDDDGGTRVFQFRIYNDKADFIRFNTAGSAFTCSSATLTAGQRGSGITIVARTLGTSVDVWVDGTKAATATITGTPKTANATFGVLGRKGGTQPFLGRCYLTGAKAGSCSDDECRALSLNPWQLFAP